MTLQSLHLIYASNNIYIYNYYHQNIYNLLLKYIDRK